MSTRTPLPTVNERDAENVSPPPPPRTLPASPHPAPAPSCGGERPPRPAALCRPLFGAHLGGGLPPACCCRPGFVWRRGEARPCARPRSLPAGLPVPAFVLGGSVPARLLRAARGGGRCVAGLPRGAAPEIPQVPDFAWPWVPGAGYSHGRWDGRCEMFLLGEGTEIKRGMLGMRPRRR